MDIEAQTLSVAKMGFTRLGKGLAFLSRLLEAQLGYFYVRGCVAKHSAFSATWALFFKRPTK